MKRHFWFILILVTLMACSRKEPTPTSQPSPTVADTPVLIPSFTLTPEGSPVPRITIVPSATRLRPTLEEAAEEGTPSPTTTTAQSTPTSTPQPTPTLQLVDAGSTDTPPPTATVLESPLPDSPLPTPSPTPSVVPSTPGPASPLATLTPSSTASQPTDTTAPTLLASPSPTFTPTTTAVPSGEAWRFEKMFAFYDEEFLEFYIWGEVVNNTDSPQIITSLIPVVYAEDGTPLTSEEDFEYLWGYEQLMGALSIAPEERLAFSCLVYLPEEIVGEDNYEILIQAEPGEDTRDDLEIVRDDFNISDWPDSLSVEGTYNNPGPDLTEYVAAVVTAYDEAEHVIGVGWLYETDPSYLTTEEHDFTVTVFAWEVVDYLELEVYTYKLQLFGR